METFNHVNHVIIEKQCSNIRTDLVLNNTYDIEK